jgi:predicted transcriptional regulator
VQTRLSTVKVDPDTLRVIGDLAHVLGRTRKDVVRDAVHAFAALRQRSSESGLDATAVRLATAGEHHRRGTADPPAERAASAGETGRLEIARMSEAVFEALSPSERLEARRSELERSYAALGARDPRFVDPRPHGYLREHLVLGVDLDEAAPFREIELTMAARLLLDLHLWVVALPAEPAGMGAGDGVS